MKRAAWLLLFCPLVLAAACNSVLGNHAGRLASAGDAGEDADDAPDAAAADGSATVDATNADADGATGDADGGDGSPCTDTLAGQKLADFSVAFTITTSTQDKSAVLNQRAICGRGSFWDVRIGTHIAGAPAIEIDDGANYTVEWSLTAVNDGLPHRILITRTSGHVAFFIDGVMTMHDAGAESNANLTVLAPLRIGTDVCEAVDNTKPLVGAVSDVCLTR